MKIKKTIVMLVLLLSLMFGMISSVYATNTENSDNTVDQSSVASSLKAEKYKKVLEIQKGSQATATKMPRTGIEDNPLLFVANVCFSAAAVGIVFVLIYSVVKKINLK